MRLTLLKDQVTDSYVGLTENSFKDRWTKHKSSFRTRNPKNASGLSRYIWNLEDQNIQYELEWKIISRAKPYDPASGVCRLCVREKYFIIFQPNMATINSRNEIAGPCLHKASRLLKKIWKYTTNKWLRLRLAVSKEKIIYHVWSNS